MTSPRQLLSRRQLTPKKQLGQNFLKDPNCARAIVRHGKVTKADTVLEIGAGLGALTFAAAQAAGRVIAVETDRRLMEVLQAELQIEGVENVELVHADILRADFEQWRPASGALIVMGNLPYNISSQVVVKLIAHRAFIKRAVVMLQKEMADRLMAQPGSREYGRMTVLLRYCAQTRSLMELGPEQFFPRPKIASKVIEIAFENKVTALSAGQEAFLVQVVRAAFGKRRKTIKNALVKSDLGLDPLQVLNALEIAGILPEQRAETVDAPAYIQLAAAITKGQRV